MQEIVIVVRSVCTCVVHKRCHQNAVTKCPGVKEGTSDEVSFSTLFYISIVFLMACLCSQMVGRQEGHPACKKTGCWFVGGDDLTGALHGL